MNHSIFLAHVVVLCMACFMVVMIFSVCFVAYAEESSYIPSSEDLWTVISESNKSESLYKYMKDSSLILDEISFDDFDYIFVLTQQLCTMVDRVPPELALAVISVESKFDINAVNGRARGLMQLIPIFHSARMSQFVEDDHLVDLDDFHDRRLNIMTGIDYLDYILSETNGDVEYALMWYNQGPTSSSKDYLDNFRVSNYARNVVSISKEIKTYL